MAVVVQWTSRASPIHTLFTLFISVVQSGFRHTQGSAGPACMLSGCSIEEGASFVAPSSANGSSRIERG